MKPTSLILLSAFLLLLFSCNDVAKAPLDENPSVVAHSRYLGIWKECSKPGTRDYLLVQNREDLLAELRGLLRKDSLNNDREGVTVYRQALSEEMATAKREGGHYFFLTEMKDGKGTGYQQIPAFLSSVKGNLFLNIIDKHLDIDSTTGRSKSLYYHFVRIMHSGRDTVAIAVFRSDSLIQFTTSRTVREFVARNINNPKCYDDTVRLYKVSNYHENIWESRKKAN
jgi:hypothetical protein